MLCKVRICCKSVSANDLPMSVYCDCAIVTRKCLITATAALHITTVPLFLVLKRKKHHSSHFMLSDYIELSDAFLQYWTGIVFGVIAIMTLVVHRKKQERRVDIPPEKIFVPRPFTAEQLREYDGIQNPLIFVGVKGVIYNVAKEWYGPQSPYNAFAGHEASRQLGKTKVGREEANADWTTLSPDHLQTLDEWEERFLAKYLPVGWFVPDAPYFTRGSEFQP